MKRIIIIGYGGLAREVAWTIENINKVRPTWDLVGFLENKINFGKKNKLYGDSIFEEDSWLKCLSEKTYVACGIGDGKMRKRILNKLSQHENIKVATIIDPEVIIDETVTVDQGSIIFKNSSLTVNTKIGKGVLLNFGSLVGHDSSIGDYTTFAPRSMVAGNTTIGKQCNLGAGCFVLEGTKIIDGTTVAPLSGVYRDIINPGVFSGNPARQIR